MDETIEQAAERAIAAMRENLGDQVTVDDMARAAMFSKFYFTRIFQRATGVSPARFLSALRLERAKELLVTTSLNVAEISVLVGYNSIGTFSARFSRSVGLSPTAYRRLGGHTTHISTRADRAIGLPTATVQGVIRPHDRHAGREVVFTGLFAERIPEGRPVRCAVLDRPGPYRFDDVPPGSWYLLAQSVPADSAGGLDPDELYGGDDGLSVGAEGPVVIRQDSGTQIVDLQLNPVRALDPPVLLALLDARKYAMAHTAVQKESLCFRACA